MRSLWFSAAVLLSVWVCDVSTAPASMEKEDRLLGGYSITDFSLYPFYVEVIHGSFHHCPGVLYDESTVITVAHCYDNVVTGYLTARCGGPQHRAIEEIILHPNFTEVDFLPFNDVALLKLAEPFDMSDYCQMAILPDDDIDDDDLLQDYVYVIGRNTGWLGYGQPVEVALMIQPDGVCSSYSLDYDADTQMCLLSPSNYEAVCFGDGGSPAMLADNTIVGLVSWVFNRCWFDSSVPSYFTRLSSYMDWIEEAAEGED
ncbi:chymotrypsin-1-like [Babylonia areolata]|uniref:chymotrypsin-1-like n=1 Tax=Babylonia areolata TaxID=304850 RepID=UPI003FD15275